MVKWLYILLTMFLSYIYWYLKIFRHLLFLHPDRKIIIDLNSFIWSIFIIDITFLPHISMAILYSYKQISGCFLIMWSCYVTLTYPFPLYWQFPERLHEQYGQRTEMLFSNICINFSVFLTSSKNLEKKVLMPLFIFFCNGKIHITEWREKLSHGQFRWTDQYLRSD